MRLDADRMLEILKATICGVVRSGVSDLSAGQLAILLVIGLESGMHTVRCGFQCKSPTYSDLKSASVLI
jgi:hypothetical protein